MKIILFETTQCHHFYPALFNGGFYFFIKLAFDFIENLIFKINSLITANSLLISYRIFFINETYEKQ